MDIEQISVAIFVDLLKLEGMKKRRGGPVDILYTSGCEVYRDYLKSMNGTSGEKEVIENKMRSLYNHLAIIERECDIFKKKNLSTDEGKEKSSEVQESEIIKKKPQKPQKLMKLKKRASDIRNKKVESESDEDKFIEEIRNVEIWSDDEN